MMLPHTISSALAEARTADTLASAVAHRRANGARPVSSAPALDVTIRLARPDDARELGRLAQLDGRGVGWEPSTDVLVAESDGAIVAARPLGGSQEAISDPFVPSAPLVALLEMRARQLAGAGRRNLRPHRGPRLTPVLRVGGAR